MSNRSHLPVTQLNFGRSSGRGSWVTYELGNLECAGKSGIYPSEKNEHRIEKVETAVEQLHVVTSELADNSTAELLRLKSTVIQLKNASDENTNDIVDLVTIANNHTEEIDVLQEKTGNDFYFRHAATGYVAITCTNIVSHILVQL